MTLPMTPSRRRHHACRAFTLLELLMVITILGVLTLTAVPAYNGVLTSAQISNGAQVLADEIKLCKTTAVGLNKPVELCLLRSPGSSDAPFKQFRSRSVEQDGSYQWLSRTRELPEGLSIASSTTLSNIVGSQTPQTNADGDEEICIRFDPSGEMSLADRSSPPSEPSRYLTVLFDSDLSASTVDLPSNFVMIQIDPRNSQVTVHRPQ